MESEQEHEITTLRALNLSPKQIATKLSLPLEEVQEIIRKRKHSYKRKT